MLKIEKNRRIGIVESPTKREYTSSLKGSFIFIYSIYNNP